MASGGGAAGSDPVATAAQGATDPYGHLEAKADDNPRKRRPGAALNHKRPRFSLKPDKPKTCQLAADFDLSFDMDRYDDPDELFAAYERYELAKKIVMRETGTSIEDPPERKQRPRRPGMLGRSYKNRFDASAISVPYPITEKQQHARTELNDDESQERNVTGSTKTKRENIEILDELLSQNLEDLDGDGAANLFQEHLQIRMINVENLRLPDLQGVRKDDLNASSAGNLSKKGPALLDIQNLLKGPDRQSLTTKLRLRGGPESSKTNLSSPSGTKSPFSQIPLLKQRLLRESTSTDLFSSAHIDEEAERSCLGAERSERHTDDDVNKRNKSSISTDHPYEAVGVPLGRQDFDVEAESNPNNHLQIEVGNCITDLPMIDERLDRSGSDLDGQGDKEAPSTTAEIEDSIAEEANQDVNLGPLVSSIVEELARDSSSKCNEAILEQQMEEPRAASPKRQDEVKSSPSREGRTRKSSRPNTSGATKNRAGRQKKPKNPVVTAEFQPAKEADAVPEELIEEVPQEMHKRQRLKKNRRTSLGAAGTRWTGGVRRSTRIKTRPLAYWKGERYLYGRIHESLATVIGMKYESPGGKADGKPHLKVQSFVSDEYRELLDLVS